MSPHWTFESRITNPDGMTISVVITVPTDTRWHDPSEASELSQMGAIQTSRLIAKNMTRSAAPEEFPF